MSSSTRKRLELDDVAALLVQTESDDNAGCTAITRALKTLAARRATSATVRAHLARARDAMVAAAKVGTPGSGLVEAGRHIELAAREGGETLDAPTARADAAPACVATTPASTPEPAIVDRIPEAPGVVPGVADVPAVTPRLLQSDSDMDLMRDFLMEARELLDNAEAALLALESCPQDGESINTVFRAFHTIKGTSAFLGLEDVTEFAHHAESLLSRVRDGELSFTGPVADLALRATDMIKALLNAVERTKPGDEIDRPAGFMSLLGSVTEAASAPAQTGVGTPQPDSPPVDAADVTWATLASEAPASSAPTADAGLAEPPVAEAHDERKTDATVRVRTDRLDRLVEMVGELVIAQAMIAQDGTVLSGTQIDLARKVSHANKMVRELQDLSMSMRMVPLKATFQKLARLVRDVARKTGKQVSFVVDGEETEIDRNMVDVIGDPLVHMVRNAIDHGIEAPEVRERLGKPRHGTVRLSAYYAGGNVMVALSDDGKGLDRDRIVRKALEKRLIESDKGLEDEQIFDLIFAPGFSTADQVTDVSGRGVGLDVVRRNVESLRGRVDITSTAGAGSTFSIRLPLTLAITDGLLVRVGAERFIVPTIGIQVTIRPERRQLSTVTGRAEMLQLRELLMPVVRLHRLFEIPDAATDPSQALLMIVGEGDRRVALMVDELLGEHQVVAKSLGDGIGKQPGIAGGAILGDGRVGLIIDLAEIAALARAGHASGDASHGASRARVA